MTNLISDHTETDVDYRRLAELAHEFLQHWNRLQAFYLDAAAGFDLVRKHVETDQAHARYLLQGTECDSEEFQDTRLFTYSRIFDGSFVTSGIHEATQGEVKRRNAANGSNFVTLGQLCVISFYDFWNDYLRREYVIAKGQLAREETDQSIIERRLKEHASFDFWGDIRLLRQSIVHHRGIATAEIKRCKLIKWFKLGNSISLSPQHMWAIFMATRKFYNDLYAEQFPPLVFTIPEY